MDSAAVAAMRSGPGGEARNRYNIPPFKPRDAQHQPPEVPKDSGTGAATGADAGSEVSLKAILAEGPVAEPDAGSKAGPQAGPQAGPAPGSNATPAPGVKPKSGLKSRAKVTKQPEKEPPMQYSFNRRLPVAGPYKPPPPWSQGIGTWAWWKPSVVYWLTCQGCREDQGCCGRDGFCEACNWRCCLSCWCPWCEYVPSGMKVKTLTQAGFGGPEHVWLGWTGNGSRIRRHPG